MLVKVKDILDKANKEYYAVGAFNTTNLETTQAILEAAKNMKSPIIIQITEKTMNYAGGRAIFNIIKNLSEFYYEEIPVGVHLDHGKSLEIIERAAEIGIDSVMYDGSRKKYSDNLMMTKKIAEFCREKGINLQAELGNVPYMKETGAKEIDWDEYMTDPDQAEEFARETEVDALAVAVGNAHDFAKERKEPDYERLAEINRRLNMPLIMHGASDWDADKVREAVKNGINCFNVDTAIRVAFISSLSETVDGENSVVSYDIREHLGKARDAVSMVVEEKIKIFGSADRI
ncbi:MAG: class II fructose-bisphosphate aldolase [Candidatus Moranbacteria bacterium]|jgi:fructose-bisphosphate aldolase class II|nr:class II fructose-bisphosphate aldolase [Candidatus Moranbacteria bacterium]MDD5652046.1 class II fructose-bisphosphate aldolase [Candidatus Moranbacteria bacterium]MDX9855357.1 class II fructose-bisphosphate aldolase [Candidatus Moranbacteria bacterium]